MDMEEIKQTFFVECEEQLAELESGLLEMEEGEADKETINAVFRSVHSIKGGAGAFQLEDLVSFAHVFETLLDLIRDDEMEATPEVVRVLLRAADVLSDLVNAARDDAASDENVWKPVKEELDKFISENGGTSPSEAEAKPDDGAEQDGPDEFGFEPIPLSLDMFEVDDEDVPTDFEVNFKPTRGLYESANEPLFILRELTGLGSAKVECDVSRVPTLDAFDPTESYLSWTVTMSGVENQDSLNDPFDFVDDQCEIEIAPIGGNEVTVPFDEEVPDSDLSTLDDTPPEPSLGVEELTIAPDQEAGEEPAAPTEEPAAEAPEPEAPEPESAPETDNEAKKAAPKAAEPAKQAAAVAPATIRVDLDRVDRLINLVGELVVNQAMLSQRVVEAGLAETSSVMMGLDELEQLTREIQDSVMAIRAQPVKTLLQRMSRVVREAADATGKVIRLRTEGETTEIDKTVIERLADPLTHMIRNAVDHGLETPEKRAETSKSEEGTIELSAAHRSGRVVIEIKDDGAGINRGKVRSIAVEKGLISQDAQLSDNEIDNLIFLPGFSTATEVSNLSGRGVGMDVVKRSIQALGGRISIASYPGRGSTFTMSLPLTLAVLDGMVVIVGNQTLVVPLTAIVETLKPKNTDVHNLGSGAAVIAVRDSFVPLIDVAERLGFADGASVPSDGVIILVETDEGKQNALLVNSIQDQRQVVIKSLETSYGHIPGVAAATILGDGRVALILDVGELVDHTGESPKAPEQPLMLEAS